MLKQPYLAERDRVHYHRKSGECWEMLLHCSGIVKDDDLFVITFYNASCTDHHRYTNLFTHSTQHGRSHWQFWNRQGIWCPADWRDSTRVSCRYLQQGQYSVSLLVLLFEDACLCTYSLPCLHLHIQDWSRRELIIPFPTLVLDQVTWLFLWLLCNIPLLLSHTFLPPLLLFDVTLSFSVASLISSIAV